MVRYGGCWICFDPKDTIRFCLGMVGYITQPFLNALTLLHTLLSLIALRSYAYFIYLSMNLCSWVKERLFLAVKSGMYKRISPYVRWSIVVNILILHCQQHLTMKPTIWCRLTRNVWQDSVRMCGVMFTRHWWAHRLNLAFQIT